LDLVCSSAYKVQLLNTILFVGCFFGSGLFGVLCDKIGRRMPLFIATALAAASMFASLAVPASQQYYWVFAATRGVAGAAAAGQSQAMFLLATEVSGPSYRWVNV
jgi:MFS family permease